MTTQSGFWNAVSSLMGATSFVLDCSWFIFHQMAWSMLHTVAPFVVIGPTKSWVPSPRGVECIVLVTGTSVGIGREIALGLARIGYTVYAGVRKDEDGESLVKEHQEKSGKKGSNSGRAQGSIRPVILEMTSKQDIDNVYTKIEEHIKNHRAVFAGVVNNAGVLPIAPLELSTDECAHSVFDVNYFGVLALTRRMLPLLRCFPGSRVICIGSIAAWVPFPGLALHCSSKAALRASAKIMDEELKGLGHRVLLIEPGVIRSRTMQQLPSAVQETIFSKTPMTQEPVQPDLDKNRERDALRHYEYVQNFGGKVASWTSLCMQPPSVVAYNVVHALQSPRPLDTYYPGLDAKMMAVIARVAPESMTSIGATMRWMESMGL